MAGRKSFYINREGVELPYGRYSECELPQHGWLHVVNRTHEIYFRADNPDARVQFKKRDYWVVKVLPDETLVYGHPQKGGYGIWSLPENKNILPREFDSIFAFLPEAGGYAVLTQDKRLQIRNRSNALLADFGVVNILNGGAFYEKKRPLLITELNEPDRKGGFMCMDMQTGQYCGPPLLHLGPLCEGIRFVHDVSGDMYFVDEQWQRVLEIPIEQPDSRMWTYAISPERDGLKCVNGCIPIPISDGTVYLMNKQGEIVIPPGIYRNIYCLGEERLYMQKRGGMGALADTRGNKLTSFCYKNDFLQYPFFRENSLCLYKKTKNGERCGCINSQGEEFLPFIYQYFIDGFVDDIGVMTI